MIRLSPDAPHVDLKLSRAAGDERHGLVRQWWNLKLLGILIVHVVAQQERTPTKLRTAHLDRAGKVLVEVTTLDHDIPPDRVESQQALRSERSTKPKPHRPREQQAVVDPFGQLSCGTAATRRTKPSIARKTRQDSRDYSHPPGTAHDRALADRSGDASPSGSLVTSMEKPH